MRTLIIAIVGLVALALSPGCSKKAQDPAPSAPPPAAAPAAATPAAATTGTPTAVPVDGAAPAAAAAEAPGAAAPAEPVAEDVPDAPPAKAKGEVSAPECAKACAHATDLSMKSLPPDATPDMKAAIQKALEEKCPSDCEANGTKAMVSCIMAAKTGMDLASCPK